MDTFAPVPSTETDSLARVTVAAARIERDLPAALSPGRLSHVMGVAEYAVYLADRIGEDVSRARLAALAHDLAREWDVSEIEDWARSDGLPLLELETEVPKVLHGRAAAVLLQRKYHICDPEVIAAVRSHTLGDIGMTRLQKVLYCADYLEPGRPYIEPEFRRRVEELDLDVMVCACVEHNTRRGHAPAARTLAMYREMCGKEYPA